MYLERGGGGGGGEGVPPARRHPRQSLDQQVRSESFAPTHSVGGRIWAVGLWSVRRGVREMEPQREVGVFFPSGWGNQTSAVGESPTRGGIGSEVVFAQRAGIVRRGVDVGLLQRVKVGSVVWKQIVLIESLKLHRSVFLILGRGAALVVEVVGGSRMDDGRLLRLPLTTLAIDVDDKRQQAGAKEARDAGGDQMDEAEPCTFFVLINAGGRQNHWDLIVDTLPVLRTVPHTLRGPGVVHVAVAMAVLRPVFVTHAPF